MPDQDSFFKMIADWWNKPAEKKPEEQQPAKPGLLDSLGQAAKGAKQLKETVEKSKSPDSEEAKKEKARKANEEAIKNLQRVMRGGK